MAASKKKPTIKEVLSILKKLHGEPVQGERLEDPLLDHLMVMVLSIHTDTKNAMEAVRKLSGSALDFNEIRVSPLNEIESYLKGFISKDKLRVAADDLRMALQDVWDNSHSLDLEPIRGRVPEGQRDFIKHLPNIPGGPAAAIYQLAIGEKHLALGPRESHLLARLGILPRASTPERIRKAVERQVKPQDRMEFTWYFGASAHMYEDDIDPSHPFCKLLIKVNAKELAVREQERKREDARLKAEEKKRLQEEEKDRKAAERERKKQAREEAKRQAELARKRKKEDAIRARKEEAARKKAAEKKRREDAVRKKKADAAKKKAAIKKAADAAKKKAAADKKKAAAKKKSAKKKPAPKKKAAKKKTAKKKTTKKKTTKKKAAKKTAKRAAPKKKTTKKKATKKKTTKKAAKKTTKKAAKKTTKKKTTKKKTTKKKTTKKKTTKKKTTKKKATARKTTRRK